MESGNYVVISIETTGLKPHEDEIIALVAVEFISFKPVGIYHTFVHPNIPISNNTTGMTGITNEMVKDAPDLDAVLPAFIDFCFGRDLVAYNYEFNHGFLCRNGFDTASWSPKIHDLLLLAKEKHPGEPRYRMWDLCRKYGITAKHDDPRVARCIDEGILFHRLVMTEEQHSI